MSPPKNLYLLFLPPGQYLHSVDSNGKLEKKLLQNERRIIKLLDNRTTNQTRIFIYRNRCFVFFVCLRNHQRKREMQFNGDIVLPIAHSIATKFPDILY